MSIPALQEYLFYNGRRRTEHRYSHKAERHNGDIYYAFKLKTTVSLGLYTAYLSALCVNARSSSEILAEH